MGNIPATIPNMPFKECIALWGKDIVEAQLFMDAHVLDLIAASNKEGEITITAKDGKQVKVNLSILAKFYQFTENSIEFKASVSWSIENQRKSSQTKVSGRGTVGAANSLFKSLNISGPFGFGKKVTANVSIHNARESSRFNIKSDMSTIFRSKMTAVSAPEALQNRLNELVNKPSTG